MFLINPKTFNYYILDKYFYFLVLNKILHANKQDYIFLLFNYYYLLDNIKKQTYLRKSSYFMKIFHI